METQEVKGIKENLTTGVDHVNLIVFYSICFVLIGFVIIIMNALKDFLQKSVILQSLLWLYLFPLFS